MPHEIDCHVQVPPEHRLGVYANAFRVLEGPDGRCQMEFLVYSDVENTAAVVSRAPVSRSLLPVIRSRIKEVLPDQPRREHW